MYSFSTCNSPFVETNKGRTSLNSLPVLFPISRRTGVNASKTAKTGDVPADWMVHLPITSATMRSMDSEHFPIPGNGFPQNPLPDKSFTRFFSKNRRGPGGSAPGRAPQSAKFPLAAAGEISHRPKAPSADGAISTASAVRPPSPPQRGWWAVAFFVPLSLHQMQQVRLQRFFLFLRLHKKEYRKQERGNFI